MRPFRHIFVLKRPIESDLAVFVSLRQAHVSPRVFYKEGASYSSVQPAENGATMVQKPGATGSCPWFLARADYKGNSGTVAALFPLTNICQPALLQGVATVEPTRR